MKAGISVELVFKHTAIWMYICRFVPTIKKPILNYEIYIQQLHNWRFTLEKRYLWSISCHERYICSYILSYDLSFKKSEGRLWQKRVKTSGKRRVIFLLIPKSFHISPKSYIYHIVPSRNASRLVTCLNLKHLQRLDFLNSNIW